MPEAIAPTLDRPVVRSYNRTLQVEEPMARALALVFLFVAASCGRDASQGRPDDAAPEGPVDTGADAPAAGDSLDDRVSDAGGDAAGEGAVDGGDLSGGDDTADAVFDAPDTVDADAGPAWVDRLDSNRDRLLGTYLAYLKEHVTTPQSNGLSGGNVDSACDVWTWLDPSARGVFLTLTARLQGSTLGIDGRSALWHVVALYRVVGGQGSSSTEPGSCGGGESNRMILSQDRTLHAAMLAANQHQGARQPDQRYDLADAPAGTFWRDSHDAAGPHVPFDRSDETDKGGPRGQTQYFADPASSLANAPLGRQDLSTLVDPYALEFDLDYDCLHNSNPLCTYTLYGPLCLPQASRTGIDLYQQSYGTIQAGYRPADCSP